jgi:hypothetical protein
LLDLLALMKKAHLEVFIELLIVWSQRMVVFPAGNPSK